MDDTIFTALYEFVVGSVEDRFGDRAAWFAGIALILALPLILLAALAIVLWAN